MIGLQAAGAAPIFHGRVIEQPETIASAIRIGKPASWHGATRAVEESHGAIDIVTDEEILSAQKWLASHEGIFVEPASTAPIAGLLKWCEAARFEAESTIVCTVTGHGLKDPAAIDLPKIEAIGATADAVRRAIGD